MGMGMGVSEEVWEIGLCLYSNKLFLCFFFLLLFWVKVLVVPIKLDLVLNLAFEALGTSCCMLLSFNEEILALIIMVQWY